MKILIAGSRGFPNREKVLDWLERNVNVFGGDAIVSGLAKGPDTWAKEWAEGYGLVVDAYPAEWSKYGKRAGYLRNVEMVEAADRVVCFWDGESPGTRHTIEMAVAKRKPLVVEYP